MKISTTLDPPLAPTSTSELLGARWIRLLEAFSALVALLGTYGWMVHRHQVDFAVYLSGAHHVASANLYNVRTGVAHGSALYFTYPPFAAVVLAPLSVLPVALAQILWNGLSLASLALVVALAWSWCGHSASWRVVGQRTVLLLGPAVLMNPVLQTLSFGQINLMITALVMLDATTTLRVGARQCPRGILIGLASAVKLVPLIWIGFFLVTRRPREAVRALASFVVATGLTFLINPSASRQYWFHALEDQRRIGVTSFVSNQSLQGLLDRLFHRTLGTGLVDLGAGVVIVVALVTAKWAWDQGRGVEAVLVVAVGGLLGSPVSWVHHYVWCVAVVIWLVFRPGASPLSRTLGVATSALYFAAPMWWVLHGAHYDLHENWWTFLAANSFALSALGGLIVAAIVVGRHRCGPSLLE